MYSDITTSQQRSRRTEYRTDKEQHMTDTISTHEALEKLGLRAASLRPHVGDTSDLPLLSDVQSDLWEVELHTDDMTFEHDHERRDIGSLVEEMKEKYRVTVQGKPCSSLGMKNGIPFYVFIGSWSDVTRFAAYVQFGADSTLARNVADKAETLEGKVVR